MKRSNTASLLIVFAVCVFVALGCSASTANLSSLKTSTDAAGAQETKTFKPGDTLNGLATVSNNPGTVKVNFTMVDPKGTVVPGSEVSVEIKGDGVAKFSAPVPEGAPAGNYKLNADMLNESGEKKDNKNAEITISE
jgi:hypothetical protein